MDLTLLKGTKDYLPSEQIIRQKVRDVLIRTFERHGFSPLETPVLNTFELMASKYAGGSEILKETYQLNDQGKRELALRYDLTVPFSRIIGFYQGIHQQLPLPFKRYEIGKVFRDGPVKSGRVREFTQCDVDVVGNSDMSAEAELITIASEVFEAIDLPVIIRVNHRKVLSAILHNCGVPDKQIAPAILSIDKLEKVGWKEVCKELEGKGVDQAHQDYLNEIFHITGTPEEVLSQLEEKLEGELAATGIEEMRSLLELLPAMGFKAILKLVPSLARGLEIYTGPVFECFLVDQQRIASSLAAGGRYDEIIGRFLEAEDPAAYPAVGLSFGLDVLYEALKQKDTTAPNTVTQAFIVPIDTQKESHEIACKMRRAGVNVDVAAPGTKIRKLFRYANQMGIPYVITIGGDELASGQLTLKDMNSGNQEKGSLEEVISRISERTNN